GHRVQGKTGRGPRPTGCIALTWDVTAFTPVRRTCSPSPVVPPAGIPAARPGPGTPGAAARRGRGRGAPRRWDDRSMSRAGLEKTPHEVASMFDDVAERYDLTNDVLSLGQDRRWRRAVTDALALRPGDRLLDLAAGTGTSSEPFAEAGVLAVPCDFSLGMLQ